MPESVKQYFNQWKRETYAQRCYRLVKQRTGIDIEASAAKNLLALKNRLKDLTSPMSANMRAHLDGKNKNVRGLTPEETILESRLLNSSWFLVHKTDKDTVDAIENSQRKELLSTEELYKVNPEQGSATFYIDEIQDGIFFSFSPGLPEGREQWGNAQFTIDMDNIAPDSLTGIFMSGCIHTLHGKIKGPNNPQLIYGTKFYTTNHNDFCENAGIMYQRSYCFEQPDGEIIEHKLDRSEEIYIGNDIKNAYCLIVIERIRQLGLVAWENIYKDINTVSLEVLQALSRGLLHHDTLEVHLPRSLNIEQPGITKVITSMQEADEEIGHKIITACYNADLNYIKSISIDILQNYIGYAGQLHGCTLDPMSAALYSGNISVVECLLTSGYSLSENIIINCYSQGTMYMDILAFILGFEMDTSIQKWIMQDSPCSKLSEEQKHEFVIAAFNQLCNVGCVNKMNSEIYSCLWLNDVYLSKEMNNVPMEENGIKQKFIKLLLKHGAQRNFPPYRPHKDFTFILHGENLNNKPWILLDYTATPSVFGNDTSRLFHNLSNKRKLWLLKISTDLHQDITEEEMCKYVASGYYAVPPAVVRLTGRKEDSPESVILSCMITDSNYAEYFAKEFSDRMFYVDQLSKVDLADNNLSEKLTREWIKLENGLEMSEADLRTMKDMGLLEQDDIKSHVQPPRCKI